MPLAVTLYSVLAHLSDPQQGALLFVIDAGISKKRKRRVERVVEQHAPGGATLQWLHPARDALKGLAGNEHLPRSAYYRLLIPDLLPGDIEKAIYLDSDVLVLEDLRRLWNIDVGTRSHLAVHDLGQPYVSSSWEAVPDYREQGLPADAKYFNSGVMLINLRYWRAERVAERVAEYVRGHDPKDLRFLDQAGLNAVLAGEWGELDPRWNQMHGIYEYDSWEESPLDRQGYDGMLNRPHLIHYTYTPKPWQPGCRHPRRRLYLRYLRASGWFTPVGWTFWKARHRLRSAVKLAVAAARQSARSHPRVHRCAQWLHQKLSNLC